MYLEDYGLKVMFLAYDGFYDRPMERCFRINQAMPFSPDDKVAGIVKHGRTILYITHDDFEEFAKKHSFKRGDNIRVEILQWFLKELHDDSTPEYLEIQRELLNI